MPAPTILEDLAVDPGRCPIDRKPRRGAAAHRFGAAALVVPDASGRHGRPARVDVQGVRRHGLASPA